MLTLLEALRDNVFYLVAAVIVVIFVLFFVGFLVLRKYRQREVTSDEAAADGDSGAESPEEAEASAAAARRTVRSTLRGAFRTGIEQLKLSAPGRDYRYHVPWFLFLAEDGAQDSLLPRSIPRSLAQEGPVSFRDDADALRWWFFDSAVVLTVGRDRLLKVGRSISGQDPWLVLVDLIRQARPERPLDGVILSIPAADLLRGSASGPEGEDELVRRADDLRATLQAIPEKLGMRVPVYFLVTGCERIGGFSQLADVLPSSLQQQIFGWSSSYPPDDSYESDWVDEAFRELHQELFRIQFQTFARRGDSSGNDGIFVFPDQFQSLRQPLRTYLDRVFKRTAYYDAFSFRGIYFSGSVSRSLDRQLPPLPDTSRQGPDSLSHSLLHLEPLADSRDQKRTLFVDDLFTRKIFREAGLAKPIDRFRAPANRRVRLVQVGVLVLTIFMGIATFHSKPRLEADARGYNELLDVVKEELPERLTAGRPLPLDSYQNDVQRLLYAMRGIKEEWYGSYFMPSSWYDSLRGNITVSMTFAYNYIILKSLHQGLRDKSDEIVPNPRDLRLAEYIRELRELEQQLSVYDNLRRKGQGDLTKLRRLVTYLQFGDLSSLSDDFDVNVIFNTALQNAELEEPFEYDRYSDEVSENLYLKIQELYDTQITNHPALADIRGLTNSLNQFDDTVPGAIPAAHEQLTEVIAKIRAAKRSLERQDSWLSGQEYDPDAQFPNVSNYLTTSQFLGSVAGTGSGTRDEVLSYFRELGQERFREGLASLEQAESDLTGPLLTQPDASGRWALAEGVLALETWLEELLDLSTGWHMTESDFGFDEGRAISWDQTYLREAVQTFKAYERVTDSVPRISPGGPWPTVERLQARLETLLERANRARRGLGSGGPHRTPSDFVVEIENFTAVAELLTEVLGVLDKPGLRSTYEKFARLVGTQARHILRHLSDMLDDENLYQVRDGHFGWWSGEQPVSFRAYRVDSPTERASYLRNQRQRVNFLAETYAKPAIAIHTAAVRDREADPLTDRWLGILSAIEAYDKQDVNSSISALESFVEADMDKVQPQNCGEAKALSESRGETSDFFLQKRDLLEGALIERCDYLTRRFGMAQYEQIAEAFNENLSGHFPFSERLPRAISRNAANRDADHLMVAELFEILDKDGKGALRFLEESGGEVAGSDQAIEFLAQLNDVRALFAAIEKTSAGEAPVLDFEVSFRENRDRRGAEREECGVNQIIDWRLEVGGQEFQYPDPFVEDAEEAESAMRGRWNFGDPIVVTLRWAKNSPCVPVMDPRKTGLDVAENHRTAVLTYRNPWSILALVRENASVANDFADIVKRPDILKIAIPVLPNQQRSAVRERSAGPLVTSAFIRFLIRPPGEPDSEILAPDFPTHAPRLGARQELSGQVSR